MEGFTGHEDGGVPPPDPRSSSDTAMENAEHVAGSSNVS